MHTHLTTQPQQRGAVAIELALVSIILMMLMFAALDLGRAMYAYNEIAQSTRAAARYLATSVTVGSAETTKARNLVTYGNFLSSGSPLAPELKSDSTAIQFCTPSICDVSGMTKANMSNQPVSGAGSVNLVMVRVSNLTLVTYFPKTVASFLFRPITVTFPRVN